MDSSWRIFAPLGVSTEAGDLQITENARAWAAGLGVFAAVPVSAISEANAVGLTLGVRAPFGFF